MSQDERYMQRCLELARRGEGRVAPNPLVGCVIVRGEQVLGEGYHAAFGKPHAEAAALAAAGERAEGATLYVNLEPCAHEGKTPPCADAIIEAGVGRVVAGTRDRNPQAAGGIRTLKSAGIEVDCPLLERDCLDLNAPFFKWVTLRKPFLIAKWAQSIDGKIATRIHDSMYVSSKTSREEVHRIRNAVDAVLVGSGTVLADNPQLTCRIAGGRDPVRVVADKLAIMPPEARIFSVGKSPVWVAVTEKAPLLRVQTLRTAGAEIINVPEKDGHTDLAAVVDALAEREVTSVMIEGGGGIMAGAFEAGIVDRVLIYVAPKIIGGDRAPGPVGGAGIERLAEALALVDMRCRQVGPDVCIDARVGEWEWERVEERGERGEERKEIEKI